MFLLNAGRKYIAYKIDSALFDFLEINYESS